MIRSLLIAAALITFSTNCPAPRGIVSGNGAFVRPEPPRSPAQGGPVFLGSIWAYLFAL